jgi:hypothetical protein
VTSSTETPKPADFAPAHETKDGRPSSNPMSQANKDTDDSYKGNVGVCIVLGLAGLIVGAFFLFDPSADPTVVVARNIVNLHRMTIGQTLMIVGSILLAAGIRPR